MMRPSTQTPLTLGANRWRIDDSGVGNAPIKVSSPETDRRSSQIANSTTLAILIKQGHFYNLSVWIKF